LPTDNNVDNVAKRLKQDEFFNISGDPHTQSTEHPLYSRDGCCAYYLRDFLRDFKFI
jgi:hypothetical protein